MRHNRKNPEDSQQTHTAAGHDHRNQYIPDTAEGTGQDLYEDEQHITRGNHLDDLHTNFDNLRVLGKHAEDIAAKQQKQALTSMEAIKSMNRQTNTLLFIREYFPAP